VKTSQYRRSARRHRRSEVAGTNVYIEGGVEIFRDVVEGWRWPWFQHGVRSVYFCRIIVYSYEAILGWLSDTLYVFLPLITVYLSIYTNYSPLLIFILCTVDFLIMHTLTMHNSHNASHLGWSHCGAVRNCTIVHSIAWSLCIMRRYFWLFGFFMTSFRRHVRFNIFCVGWTRYTSYEGTPHSTYISTSLGCRKMRNSRQAPTILSKRQPKTNQRLILMTPWLLAQPHPKTSL